MVDVAQIIPTDPHEQASVLAVLREHPDLREFIQRAIQKAEQIFPDTHFTFDTARYEEDDPLVWLRITAVEPLLEFSEHYREFTRWLVDDARYPQDIVGVLPLWGRPNYQVVP